MSLEETFATMRRLPSDERAQLLKKIEQWLEQTRMTHEVDVQRALAAVARTWGSISLETDLARWVAESKELEYDIR
ncbi:MAG: hypothetical protein B6D41_17930 [Chloroflexi bacterium UTCFX4]|jgi:hypothetical protein|nr:MAG: hypothetical protein B6D41_17930 [Chloroflexi bacterium UTCFX4]